MKSDNPRRKPRVCPICGKTYSEPPAISRIDGESEICSDCGILQSLATLGIDQKSRTKFLKQYIDIQKVLFPTEQSQKP